MRLIDLLHRFGLAAMTGLLLVPWPARAADPPAQDLAPGRAMAIQATKARELWVTADHTQHAALQQPLKSGPEVTKACLSCHNQAAIQFHKTIHWTWLDPNADPAQQVGKGGLSVNNFCISLQSNEPRCTSCHAGYGWKDKQFDFSDVSRVDCLVCHEQTGSYKKFPTMAGNVVTESTVFKEDGKTYDPPDWNAVAQSVGRPGRKNCGTCHFYGGGGDGVKHGDLDSSMAMPNKQLDVHMGTDGKNFDCVRCHTTSQHRIAGRIYATPAATARKSLIQDDLTAKIMCESCHGDKPHQAGAKPNDHTDKVACQSCHIPEMARVNPTKVRWDWSTAGKMKDGKPYKVDGELGKPVYDSKKGDFIWARNVTPEYFWFNGAISGLTARDAVDPGAVVRVNWPQGAPADPNSRIFPFKVHRGKQPYDKVHKTILIPKLFGPPESAAYWQKYDWKEALAAGMNTAKLPYSGEFDFVETSYVFPTTHMVAPKEKAVACAECHTREASRLAGIGGVYMPARDSLKAIRFGGWAIVLACLAGVLLHGLGRVFTRGRKEG